MMNNKAIIALTSIVVIFGFLYAVYAFTNKPVQTYFPEVSKLAGNDHVKWSPAKKHVLVEYSDLQCPACKMFHDNIKQTIETDKSITDNVTFVYRHFPLDNIHPYARQAAYAAEAAHKQDKFFEMVDKLFATQETWSKGGDVKAMFSTYAKEIGLDVEQFQQDMDSDTVKKKVEADFISGNAAQVDATPTFYLDGNKVVVNSFADFKKLLQETGAKK